jgi:hypothetical protein
LSKTNALENAWLLLLFNNTNIANIGDATGLRGSSTAGSLYLSFHSSDPGEAGDQTTNEVSYTGYARKALARSGSAWVVTGNSVSPAADVTFDPCTAGSATVTYVGVGTASSGAGVLLYKGTITPSISISNGVTPEISSTSTLTED